MALVWQLSNMSVLISLISLTLIRDKCFTRREQILLFFALTFHLTWINEKYVYSFFWLLLNKSSIFKRKVWVFCCLHTEDWSIFLEDDFSGNRFRRDTWKTSQVLSCIRQLRSIIIHPSKHDVSSQIMDCLKGKKTIKPDKKKQKTWSSIRVFCYDKHFPFLHLSFVMLSFSE